MHKKLLTWLDIERTVRKKTNNCTLLPDGVLGIDFYSDALEIIVESGGKISSIKMLKDWFLDWFNEDSLEINLDLGEQVVEVEFIESNNFQKRQKAIKPLWHDIAYVNENPQDNCYIFDMLSVKPFNSIPEVIAFHSFKGGVGRTTLLVCYLFKLIEKFRDGNNKSILLIDSDLEAPGITYWFAEKDNRPNVSFIDFMEAVHYSPDKNTVHSFFANELKKGSINIQGTEIYILPAFTDESQLLDIQILPEHITQAIKGNWNYANEIHGLGVELGVDNVFIDLRAGLSEISSPLLFDPRIERFLVTTVAEQSAKGTGLVLKQISKIASCIPIDDKDEFRTISPNVVLSMLTAELKESGAYERAMMILNESYDGTSDSNGDLGELLISEAFFDPSILSISSWDDAKEKLNRSPLIGVADAWAEDLFSRESQPPTATFSEDIVTRLYDICQKYEFAEKGESEDVLITEPLKNMAKKFSDTLPMIVSIGAKGAGKTFCYLEIARCQNWNTFLAKVLGSKQDDFLEAFIFPLSQASQLHRPAEEILYSTRQNALQTLGVEEEFLRSELVSSINNALKKTDWGIEEWISFWIKRLGASIGFQSEDYSLSGINRYLKEKSVKLVFLFDGLEDIFRDVSENRQQQNAIEALFELPKRVSEIRIPYLGIIIFIRQDYVKYTISQNRAQFEALYKPYSLTWNSLSFIQLVYWICGQAGVEQFESEKVYTMQQTDILKELESLWGKKLGRANSKEAFTAKWVFAALTDFNGKLQARDIVRILLHASKLTLNNHPDIKRRTWESERILPPVAIRRSIDMCSTDKIKEASEEFPKFKSWVENMDREYRDSPRIIPFTPDQYNMGSSTIEMLKDMGVIFEYQDKKEGSSKYYMPEIFRAGLRFSLS